MDSDPCCLLTGFEPFDGDAVNPSWQIAQALHGQRLHGTRVVAEQLPCTFDGAPDNAGAQPIDEPVQAGAPAAHFSTLPIKAMLAALREAGIAAEVSQTAGTFVCNQVFYGLMQALRRRPGVRGGFVHVPLLPEQAAARGLGAGMALDQQIAGVRLALATALATAQDLRLGGGRLD